jgi:predicted aspartyl protease
MITGAISRFRAYVNLVVSGPAGQEGEIEFVLDTGFVGDITLPPVACAAFGFPYLRPQPASLADGSRVVLEVYEGILA